MLAESSVMVAWLAVRVGLESGLAPGLIQWISNRPELLTPVTGWKQLKEGIYLLEEGLDPYDSGIFHHSPLLLHLFLLIKSPILVALVYGLVDCFSAWVLLGLFRLKWPKGGPIKAVKLRDDRWMLSPTYQIKDWHLILLSVDRMALSMFSLSIGTHLSVYPILLVPACIGIIHDQRLSKSSIMSTISQSVGLFLSHFLTLGLFTPLSVLFSQIDVNKHLRPNVGLHWYFSIEMFDHFRLFFNVVFQIHLLMYIVPLLIRFKKEKVFGFIVMSGIISTFKSYPSIGDASFSNTLLVVLYPELIAFFRHPLLTVSLYFCGLCLLPAFHHIWLDLGSGNANFYYASTLVWAVANGLVWIDSISAMLRRDFQINELGSKEIDKSSEVIVQI